jgi:beta-lactamase regulating signal transducer with metallopeptidase domain
VIEEPLPVVTVVGVVRPRLYIARPVLEGCSPAELAAIVSHETAHVEHRDNLKRLVLRSLPDWIGLTPWAARTEQMWSEATEDAADDRAAGQASAPDLAAALLKVARLAAPTGSCITPASALYHGGDLARRIERLLRPGRARATTPLPLLSVGSFGLVAGLALGVRCGLLERVHGLTEVVVRLLQ